MITIKDIAKLSGVSITTVSKIVNNKADDISQETIDKVLDIVKKHNYHPYSVARKKPVTKSLSIVVLLRNMDYTNSLIEGILDYFNKSGYSLFLYNSSNDLEIEKQNIHKITGKEFDGILWQPVNEKSLENKNLIEEKTNNIIYMDALLNVSGTNYYIDFTKLAYFCTEELTKANHTNIACVIKSKDSVRSKMAIEGFKSCLFNNNIPFNEEMIINYDEFDYDKFKLNNYTAIFTSHFYIAKKLYEMFEINKVHIPSDISIVSLYDDERNSIDINNISSVKIPKYDFGYFVGKEIVSLCEDKSYEKKYFNFSPTLESYCSISTPYYSRLPKITVVGSINIDNIIYLDAFPSSGNTEIASECISVVGGKALNQSTGVKMLKKEVSIIGKVGKDNEATMIRNHLINHGIDITHLIFDERVQTGKAYIAINKAGDSTITLAKGANNTISPEDIKNEEAAFDNAGICLLQSEVPLETIKAAAKIAKERKAITIFKPATIKTMEDEYYKNIDIFVPNRNEALLLSKKNTVEEAANYFYCKGIKNVIITLDKDGALLKNKDGIKYYETKQTNVIDATGGSDAFISALACQLIENKDLDYAIKVANIAAAYCISKFGVSNSMIDYETLQRILSQEK